MISGYAAAVGTGSLAWQVLQWRWNGRSDVAVSIEYELQVGGAGDFYAPAIVVRNQGRAVAYVKSAYFLLLPESAASAMNSGRCAVPATSPVPSVEVRPLDESRFRAERKDWRPIAATPRGQIGASVLLGSGEELRIKPARRRRERGWRKVA